MIDSKTYPAWRNHLLAKTFEVRSRASLLHALVISVRLWLTQEGLLGSNMAV